MKLLISVLSFVFAHGPSLVSVQQSGTPSSTVTLERSGAHEAFGGVWILNADKTQTSGRDGAAGGAGGEPGGRRGDGGGIGGPGGVGGGGERGGFGPPGGGGFGGPRGGGAGGPGGSGGFGGRGVDPDQMRAALNYVRSMMAPAARLTIVVRDPVVTLIDGDGKRVTLEANDRKTSERAENGVLKLTRKTRWDGVRLVSEIDVEKGPKIEQRFEVQQDPTELRVSTSVKGGFAGRGGGNRAVTHVYEHPSAQ